MTALSELFTPTFLMFLGILLLVVALVVVYFESKMRDQNHKIASMLSLVSTLAEDMNNVKLGLNHVAMSRGGSQQQDVRPLEHQIQNNTIVKSSSHLITVSDDEDDTDDETDASDDDDSDDEDSQDEDSHDVSDDETDDDEDDESIDNKNDIVYNNIDTRFDYNSDGIIFSNDFNNVKILKLNIFSQDDGHKYEANSKIEEIDENSFNNDAESIEDLEDENLEDENLEDENLEELNDEVSVSISIMSELPDDELPDDLEEFTSDNTNVANQNMTVSKVSSGDFKRIAINLGEDQPAEQVDYKKLQLPKLRSIAVEKGLTSNSEASKLKKQDLLKMLESE